MPRRDVIALLEAPVAGLDFLLEHVRHALEVWPRAQQWGVSWELFLDAVLPYSVLNEKRDTHFRWRPRFAALFGPLVAEAGSPTAAMHALVDALPQAAAGGVLAFVKPEDQVFSTGQPLTWHSSRSPEMLSPEQVVRFGGSCTGTGIVLVAAARSVGVPARLAGCSESVTRGDDHHWIEFWDGNATGPLGDSWHTKEGVSAGNEGGPWDEPSAPMLGCLQGVTPGDSLATIWASDWASDVHQPTLWAADSRAEMWARVGGINRCGSYCRAWGCGAGNAQRWSQAECGPQKVPEKL